MRHRLEFLCILALVTVIAALSSGDLFSRSAVPEAGAREKWAEFYQKGSDYIYLGKPERAVEPLTEAAEIALRLPAGDYRLSETYDDLAHAHFLLKDYKQAEILQGKAVAALLLCHGPNARDLAVFVDRFGMTTHQSIDPATFPAFTLVGTHTPYDGERFETERALLVEKYREIGDPQAVEFLESL